MAEFTPTTEQVRAVYVIDGTRLTNDERGQNFDRWLDAQIARAHAEGFKDCIDSIDRRPAEEPWGGSIVWARSEAGRRLDALAVQADGSAQ